ncbi:MAG: DUF559 domain-containing protein [Vicinamibacterales bacterium]
MARRCDSSVGSGVEARLLRQRPKARARWRGQAAREPVRPRRPNNASRRRRRRPSAECDGSLPVPATGDPTGDQRTFRRQRGATDRIRWFWDTGSRSSVCRRPCGRGVGGAQHLADPAAYRRDRRKDQLLQENGYFVLRFLAEDVGKELDLVLNAILRSLSQRRAPLSTLHTVTISRRSQA